jgi:ATP adenylyltransferase
MEHLWSPWRSKYISSFKDKKEDVTCFLCEAAKCTDFNNENLVVYKSDYSVVLMNRYPYNSGHLLIAPNIHIGDILNLEINHLLDINILIQKSIIVLNNLYHPHGYNIGANLGRAAGAGVPDHLHFHVVPRWNGDTNFVPVLSEVKIISEYIEEARERIEFEFKRIAN